MTNLQAAQQYIDDGNYNAAIEVLKKILRDDPFNYLADQMLFTAQNPQTIQVSATPFYHQSPVVPPTPSIPVAGVGSTYNPSVANPGASYSRIASPGASFVTPNQQAQLDLILFYTIQLVMSCAKFINTSGMLSNQPLLHEDMKDVHLQYIKLNNAIAAYPPYMGVHMPPLNNNATDDR